VWAATLLYSNRWCCCENELRKKICTDLISKHKRWFLNIWWWKVGKHLWERTGPSSHHIYRGIVIYPENETIFPEINITVSSSKVLFFLASIIYEFSQLSVINKKASCGSLWSFSVSINNLTAYFQSFFAIKFIKRQEKRFFFFTTENNIKCVAMSHKYELLMRFFQIVIVVSEEKIFFIVIFDFERKKTQSNFI
jgi:hypothetical protein